MAIADIQGATEPAMAADERAQIELAAIFDNSAVGVVFTCNRTIERCNQRLAEIFGHRRPQDLIGKPALVLYPDADTYDRLGREAGPLLAAGQAYRGDWQGRKADGSPVWCRIYGKALDPARSELGTLWIIEDVSEEHVAKAALRNAHADLEQFAYVASHDLQEPLRMVGSYVQLIEQRYQDKLDDAAREFIGFAVDGARRMQGMINGLLSYSRIGTRGKPFAPIDCEQVLASALGNLRKAIEETGAQITHDPLPTVMGDATQLTQLFQNFIANALKFRGEAPPQIHVGVAAQDGCWQFSVRDNGIGIAPEYFEKIFVLFQRLHARSVYPGTGIGLAVCKKVVERHGGRVWVESSPGQGATFYFTVARTAEPGR